MRSHQRWLLVAVISFSTVSRLLAWTPGPHPLHQWLELHIQLAEDEQVKWSRMSVEVTPPPPVEQPADGSPVPEPGRDVATLFATQATMRVRSSERLSRLSAMVAYRSGAADLNRLDDPSGVRQHEAIIPLQLAALRLSPADQRRVQLRRLVRELASGFSTRLEVLDLGRDSLGSTHVSYRISGSKWPEVLTRQAFLSDLGLPLHSSEAKTEGGKCVIHTTLLLPEWETVVASGQGSPADQVSRALEGTPGRGARVAQSADGLVFVTLASLDVAAVSETLEALMAIPALATGEIRTGSDGVVRVALKLKKA